MLASVRSNAQPGTNFSLGVTRVDYVAEDVFAHTATCSFHVHVLVACGEAGDQGNCSAINRAPCAQAAHRCGACQPGYIGTDGPSNEACARDVLPPVVQCPVEPQDVYLHAGQSVAAVVTYPTVTVTDDDQNGPLDARSVPPNGTGFAPGTTVVMHTVTDAAGNQAQCNFSVTVHCPVGLVLVARRCVPPTTCAPGSYVAAPSTATTDRECAACAAGQFQGLTNQPSCQPCRPCLPGHYRQGCLDTDVRANDAQCQPCPPETYSAGGAATHCLPVHAQCATGFYETAAATISSDTQCTSCSPCPPGQYISRVCAQTRDTQCAACTTDCRNGTYLEGECLRNATRAPECRACDATCAQCSGPGPEHCDTCAEGLALHDGMCMTQCPLHFFQVALPDSQQLACRPCAANCQVCVSAGSAACRLCASGTFLHLGQCMTVCPTGFFGNNVLHICVPCSTCPPDQVVLASCNAHNDTLCSGGDACGANEFRQPNGSCTECLECQPGSFAAKPCTPLSDSICQPCDPGQTFQSNKAQPACMAVRPACPSGTHQAAPATVTSDRVCHACVAGVDFQPQPDQATCLAVTRCQPGSGEWRAPTSTSDRICIPCTPGFDYNANGSATCMPVSTCSPGTHVVSPPNATHDRQVGSR